MEVISLDILLAKIDKIEKSAIRGMQAVGGNQAMVQYHNGRLMAMASLKDFIEEEFPGYLKAAAEDNN